MIFRNLFLFFGLTMIFSVAFTGEPSHAQKPHKFRVQVIVSCEDKYTTALIQSQIKRELRSLGDVIVVGFDDAKYILSLVVVEPIYKATGTKIGDIAIAYMLVTKVPFGDFYYPKLWLYTGDTKDLDRLCKGIVANVDTQKFELIRELFQQP